ncbi:D-amino acid oxidase, putative [Talaromyces stipitatus ATCC 10500]|uniref:D-amino acid oxidase, putative n=1 Tax=Talaromyces stipitatus (strain ATCC 10500 / CBS 375.48 / QM 6759 / NRRL 1006) TaxID=441959 RepID=B8M057_TALSN|nr:D-amino acid oxidase, putative [Talaromyces stipitatus ATCC 10500]EED21154.1 D-amino acid oxidase, putative [Talaromyces stipitatus ATCC 10500]
MQAEAFAYLWSIAHNNPESSVIEMVDIQDETPLEKIWYRGLMPDVNKSLVLNPHVFLLWLRKNIEDSGVKFVRREINSLSELRDEGHDVLVNATGFGSKFLHDVADNDVQLIRGQTHLVKTDHNKIFMRHGQDYTYIIPRLDGTAILGGIKQVGETYTHVDEEIKKDVRSASQILARMQMTTKSSVITLIRPGRPSGVRVEFEQLGDQKVVHAYGTGGGGYVFQLRRGKGCCELG